MGQRGADLEPATEDDVRAMGMLVAEALEAGALGFSTSRTFKHKDKDGNHTPSFKAEALELHGIAKALRDTGKGVMQLISDFYEFEYEWSLIRGMAEVSGRPLSLTIEQDDRHPEIWSRLLKEISTAAAQGINIRGQVPPRATGVLMGLTTTFSPLMVYQTFQQLKNTTPAEKLIAMRDANWRQQLVTEASGLNFDTEDLFQFIVSSYHKMFELGNPPNYEPTPQSSVAERAKRAGQHPLETLVDILLQNEGTGLLYMPLFNYTSGNLDDVHSMLTHEHTIFGLGDAGAHCGVLCDASFPTTLLTHWGRDRTRGKRLPLQWLIQGLTMQTAQQVGLNDRGQLKPGYRADINVIDFDNLNMTSPQIFHDLPAGGKRLMQRTSGYTASIVKGRVAFRNGEPTGELHGALVRGARSAD